VDELYEVTLVRQPLFELLQNYRVSGQMPHVLLTKLFATFCDDILCLRMGSIVTGTLSIPLIYLLGQKLGARSAIGTYSAILLSVTAAHLRYSTFIRGYSLMTCLALISLLAFWQALQTNRRLWWILFSISTTLNIYNQIFSALLVLPLLVFLAGRLWGYRRDPRQSQQPVVINILLAGGIAALLLLPMVGLFVTQQSNTDNLNVLFNTDWPTSFPPVSLEQPGNLFSPLQKLASEFTPIGRPGWLTTLLVGFLLVGLYRGFNQASSRAATRLLALALFIPPLLLSTTATLLQPWFWAFWRFVIFVIGPYLILISLGLYQSVTVALKLWRRVSQTSTKPAQIFIPVLILLPIILPPATNILKKSQPYTNPFNVARVLHPQVKPNDVIICVPDEDWRISGGREPCSLTLNSYPNLSSRIYYLDQLATYPILPQFLEADGRCINRYSHLPHPEFKLDCAPNKNIQKPTGVWLILWRNRDVSSEAASRAVIPDSQRVDATDLLYLQNTNDTNINSILQDAGTIAVNQAGTPLRRLENSISLATIYLATGNIPQALAVLDEAAFVSRWPEAVTRLTELQTQLSFLPLPITPQRRLNITWNNKIQLLGLDHLPEEITANPGTPLQASFLWQIVGSPSWPYQVLLHLVDEQNQPVATFDFQPFDGRRPLTDWPMGQTIRETRTIELPPTLIPGKYRLLAGLYQPNTLNRLPISQGGTGELMTLTTIHIP